MNFAKLFWWIFLPASPYWTQVGMNFFFLWMSGSNTCMFLDVSKKTGLLWFWCQLAMILVPVFPMILVPGLLQASSPSWFWGQKLSFFVVFCAGLYGSKILSNLGGDFRYFLTYLGRWSNFTIIFQMRWNRHLGIFPTHRDDSEILKRWLDQRSTQKFVLCLCVF